MKTKTAVCLLALAALAIWGFGNEASADDGFYASWTPLVYGGSAPNTYVGESIPYYAAHPPVYYSYPRARPYGYSPYPWPPVVTPTECAVATEPLIIKNPHVTQEREEVPAPDNHSAQAPLRFSNPHVVQAGGPELIGPTAKFQPAVLTMPVVVEGVSE